VFARRLPILRWFVALALVLFAWSAQEWLRELVGGRSFLMLAPAALGAAVVAGFGPGVLATVLAVGAAWYRFVPPVDSLELRSAGDAFSLVVVAGTGIAFGLVGDAFARTLDREVAANDRAREALQSRDVFLSIASHEFRNPLTTLGLNLDLLERKVARCAEDPALKGRVATAKQQATALRRLVEDLVDVTRAQHGTLGVQPVDADLVAVAKGAVAGATDALEAAGCTLVVDTEPQLPCRCDASRIAQVITNLLSNAARYAAGSDIELKVARRAGHAVVVVRDHGPGVPATLRERLFEPYQRGAEGHSGLGLGLYVSRSIVEAHGGRLALDDPPGGGASFRVELPL
jgi:signal transduction histidine kinase